MIRTTTVIMVTARRRKMMICIFTIKFLILPCCFLLYVWLQSKLLYRSMFWCDYENTMTLSSSTTTVLSPYSDSPLFRMEWHRYSEKSHFLSKLFMHPLPVGNYQKNRVLMIQFFPSVVPTATDERNLSDNNNNDDASSSSSSSSSSRQQQREVQRYTRQVNKDYAKHWKYDYLQIMGTGVNRTQCLLEILDDLERSQQNPFHSYYYNNYYDRLLLLPHASILLNDFLVDVSAINSNNSYDAVRHHQTRRRMQRGSSQAVGVHTSSPVYCDKQILEVKENNNNNISPPQSRVPKISDLLWNEGMLLWSFPSVRGVSSFSTRLRSIILQDSRYYDSSFNSDKNNNNINNNNNIDDDVALSCFPDDFLGRVYCDGQRRLPETPPQIKWYKYSNQKVSSSPTELSSLFDQKKKTTTNRKQQQSQQVRPRLLIGQYSGHGIYGKLLNITSDMSRRYCRKWKHCDVLVIQGKPWEVPPLDTLCPSPEHRSSFTKITLLHMALMMQAKSQPSTEGYDQLLLLDADALVYDWNVDVTTLLTLIQKHNNNNNNNNNNHNPDYSDGDGNDNNHDNLPMMTGQMIQYKTENYTWNVNNGVTLWNLKHPKIQAFAKAWDDVSSDKILQVAWKWRSMSWERRIRDLQEFDQRYMPRRVGDQETMHNTLRDILDLSSAVYGSIKVMEYDDGTVVKHLKRRNNKQWGNVSDAEYRYQALKELSRELCERYPSECGPLD